VANRGRKEGEKFNNWMLLLGKRERDRERESWRNGMEWKIVAGPTVREWEERERTGETNIEPNNVGGIC
jgi:hypothetical protein